MHKHTALTTKEPASAVTVDGAVINAEARSQAEAGLTEAEQVTETLRQKHTHTADQTPAQEREAKVAAGRRDAVAKLRADTDKRRNTVGQNTEDTSAERPALSEAQRKIDRYEAEAEKNRRQRQGQGQTGPTQARGPRIDR